MKKITFLFTILISFYSFSQSNDELFSFYSQMKSQGFSDIQIKDIARSKGYNIDQLLKNSENNSKNSSNSNISEKDPTFQSKYSNYVKPKIETTNNNKIYGSQYFNDFSYDFSPQVNIATPSNYQLGPGDGLIISLWGASQASYRLEIDREGKILIEGIGPVYLNGYTLLDAKGRIKNALSKIYKGLNSKIELEKVNLDLSLSATRSVFVSIIGQVKAPGIYTLNGMSSPIHALYAAGGISSQGSYRNVQLVRKGKVIANIDLYQYFNAGDLSDLFLKDQDVIRVPYYQNRINLQGEVKFRGSFELKENETLEDLIKYSGGFAPKAQKDNFLISRIESSSYTSISTTKSDFNLVSGDKVFVYSISEQENQKVSISGEVLIPGSYSLSSLETIQDLIKSSKGFTKDAYPYYASLYRRENNSEEMLLSVGLDSKGFDLNLNEPLQERDSLVIYNINQFLGKDKVQILGKVANPGSYDFYRSMSIQDLLGQAQGITVAENKINIIVSSRDEIQNDYIKRLEFDSFDFKQLATNYLKPGDIVSVIEKDQVESISIQIEGEVKNPGVYVQTKTLNTVKNLVELSGGLTDFANENSIYIKRNAFFIPVNNLDENYFFYDNDRLVFEKTSNDVSLTGEVIKPSIVKFKDSGLRYYLNKTGLKSSASKKEILVIYPNKDISSVKNFLFFKKYPKIKPGSEIIIGRKPERQKISSQELIAISSGLSTLIIVLSSILTN
ncbi:MAG: SLBB domain-containing protein [Flavobacteriaceae bacterium]|nr:SLBB domain-containing protein [Flavobacteriaceae bacterium]